MVIELSENETVLKNWDYATVVENGFFKPKTNCSLIITDKRIVHMQTKKQQTKRKEIPLKSVTAVETSVTKKRPWDLAALIIGAGIVLIILGALLMYCNLSFAGGLSSIIVGAILIIIAILILIFNLKVRLSINVKTNINIKNTDNVSASANMFTVKRRVQKNMRVELDSVVADEIVNTIGIVLLAEKE